MNADQLTQIVSIFQDGPQAHGFPGHRWTTAKMASAIEAMFGIHYDPDHVGRLMNRLGLKQQTAPQPYTQQVYEDGTTFAAA